MRIYILFPFLAALSIGATIAENVEIGDVDAFKLALEQDGFIVQDGDLGFLDLIKLYDIGILPSVYGNVKITI